MGVYSAPQAALPFRNAKLAAFYQLQIQEKEKEKAQRWLHLRSEKNLS